MNEKRELWIDIIRIVLTVFVLIGHCGYIDINTAFGGIRYGETLFGYGISDTDIHQAFLTVVRWIYSFHMPIFIALSGILFEMQIKNGKWGGVKQLIKSKVKRLLLPCVFMCLFWNIPLKYVSKYYLGTDPLGALLQIIFSNNVYLWFVESLFFCFIICFTIRRIESKKSQFAMLIIMLFCGIAFDHLLKDYIPLGNPLKYSIWFWMGMEADSIIKWLREKHLWNNKLLIFIGAHFCLFILTETGVLHFRSVLNVTINPLLLFLPMIYYSQTIANHNKNQKAIQHVSSYSFGIYLFSDPINYLILYVTYYFIGKNIFTDELLSFVLIIARLFITTFVAFVITHLLRKSSIGTIILGKA